VVGQKLTEAWGQQTVIDQRGRGAAAVSAELVAKARPDGYTLLLATSTHATHMVTPGQAPQTYDLIRVATARPGKLNYASGGSGSPPHLTMELFKTIAGVDIVHVPYKTIAAGVVDLMAGQIQVMFTVAPSGLPHINSGRIRALAVSSAKRSPFAPQIPTVAEAGVPGFDIFTWNGVLAPAGTPPAVVAKLQSGLVAALKSPDVQERIVNLGFEPLGTTSDEFGQFLRSEVARWTKVVRQSGARID
jgi:tripartite-type tricarboxylate transporter receptor subunit TctC